MVDLNAASVEAAMQMVEGTARSMGIVVNSFLPWWEDARSETSFEPRNEED